jgi:hypothetical protein
MLNPHQFHGFGYATWLKNIHLQGFPGRYIAKPTTARADIAEDHKRRCASAPALSHIWAVSTFADGV